MRVKLFKLLFSILLMQSINSFANNIQITNIRLANKNTVDNYVSVVFNISWENSWRLSSAPANWDAAWVFIKFRQNNGAWQHATLGLNNTNHDAPSGCTVDAVNDGMGVFIYRSDNGSGNNNWIDIDLRWLYGENDLSDDASGIEIKVFAIEMVYVPQGSFYVGDGSSIGRLWNADDVNTNPAYISTSPITIKCEAIHADYQFDGQLEGDGILIDGDGGIDVDGNTIIDNPNFPTGYNAFYCMKYELSNQQVADFLSTLTLEQQNTRTFFNITQTPLHPYPMNHVNVPQSRNCVRGEIISSGEPLNFFCDLNENGNADDANDGANIAICNIGWPDGTSFSDWAGLRPMTELEYEKACRGPEIPIANEYAWHTTNVYGDASTQYNINNLGEENSYPSNPGTGIYANAQYKYTTGHDTQHDAPLRCGMFATSNSNRINAGASYYGIMDLSGTMAERTVSLGHIDGRNFQGTNGDGILTTTIGYEGNANNEDWPGYVAGEEADGIKTWEGSGFRGGDWNDDLTRLQVSERFYGGRDPFDPTGNIGSGYRAVRTAE